MLVLTRKVGERLLIGDTVVLEVLEVRAGRVRFGIQAPRGVSIMRQELLREIESSAAQAEVDQRLAPAH